MSSDRVISIILTKDDEGVAQALCGGNALASSPDNGPE